METYIKLSWWQRWKLRKFFEGVETANIAGDYPAIGAQIWKDGMHVRLFLAEKGKALSAALGGRWENDHSSMVSKRDSTSNKP